MAAGILLTVVVSVTAAITAGQQNSQEAQLRIIGAMAAEELLGRVASDNYSHIPTWNGHIETVGQMTDMKGAAMPSTFGSVGRRVTVTTSIVNLNTALNVTVRGATVQVKAFDSTGRTLTDISRFVPEPQS